MTNWATYPSANQLKAIITFGTLALVTGCASVKQTPEHKQHISQVLQKNAAAPSTVVTSTCFVRKEVGSSHINTDMANKATPLVGNNVVMVLNKKGGKATYLPSPMHCAISDAKFINKYKVKVDGKNQKINDVPYLLANANTQKQLADAFNRLYVAVGKVASIDQKNSFQPRTFTLSQADADIIKTYTKSNDIWLTDMLVSDTSFARAMAVNTVAIAAQAAVGANVFYGYLPKKGMVTSANYIDLDKRTVVMKTNSSQEAQGKIYDVEKSAALYSGLFELSITQQQDAKK